MKAKLLNINDTNYLYTYNQRFTRKRANEMAELLVPLFENKGWFKGQSSDKEKLTAIHRFIKNPLWVGTLDNVTFTDTGYSADRGSSVNIKTIHLNK